MSDAQKREAAIAACREALSAWIERGDDKAKGRLTDALHALSACRGGRRVLRDKPGRPRRPKAA